jgi:hypothetical protein
MMDLGFTPEATWAIIAVTRAFAAGAHGIEEIERGEYRWWGQTLTPREDYYGPADRPIPPLEDRDKVAIPAQIHTLGEWKEAMDERRRTLGSGFGIREEMEDLRKQRGTKQETSAKRVGH